MRCLQEFYAIFTGSLALSWKVGAFVVPGTVLPLRSRAAAAAAAAAVMVRQSLPPLHTSVAAVETMEEAQSIILSAAERRDQDPDTVIEAIRLIERKGKSKQSREREESSAQPKFDLLTTNGKWRLIFTTGDMQTQKAIGGKLTYVPIKAVQVFNPDYTITNGVYLGSFPLLKFDGTFTWQEDKSRLEFTFNQVGVLGLSFPYNQGQSKVQPGFTFMDISDRYVIARGAGGGLALWLRQDSI